MNNFLSLSFQHGIRASTILATALYPLTTFHLIQTHETKKKIPSLPEASFLNSTPISPAASCTAFSPWRQPEILSPSMLDLPSLALILVMLLIPDPFNRSPHPNPTPSPPSLPSPRSPSKPFSLVRRASHTSEILPRRASVMAKELATKPQPNEGDAPKTLSSVDMEMESSSPKILGGSKPLVTEKHGPAGRALKTSPSSPSCANPCSASPSSTHVGGLSPASARPRPLLDGIVADPLSIRTAANEAKTNAPNIRETLPPPSSTPNMAPSPSAP